LIRLGNTFIIQLLGCLVWLPLASQAQYWQPQCISGGDTHRYIGGYYGGGVSMADFDKDGWDDVLFCQNGNLPMLLKSMEGELQPWPLGISETGEMKQFAWVDFDNDGDRDLSLTGFNIPIRLYRNDGNVFVPLTANSGIPTEITVAYGHCWGDYDLDGDLDLFVCTYDAAYMGFTNSENRLYRNDGNSTFSDVTLQAGLLPMQNYTFMAIWMDYDRDLYPDLFITNDRLEVPNYFYHNNGDGTFSEIAAAINLDDYLFSMTATSDDFDNDGDLDIYITNGTSGNYHKQNEGESGFLDVNEEQGTTLNRFCWNAMFVDANRDGWQDLHVCSSPHITLPGQNFLYLNSGESFTLANDSAGIASDDGWSRSAALGDFNRDGMADLAVCKGMPSYSSMWRAVPNANNWLKATLEGVDSNRDGVGSWIDCYSGLGMQSRYTFCGEGYLAQNSFSEFFGLGSQTMVDSLVVHWPSGIVDRWYRIPVNQQLYLVEGTSRPVTWSAPDGLILCGGDSVSVSLNEWSAYEWNSGDSMQVVQTYAATEFTAAVTDEWGNIFWADTLQVVQAELPIVDVQMDSVSCFNFSDAVIYASATMPVEFALNGNTSEMGVFSGLHSDEYILSWVDNNGCSSSQQLLITEPEPLQASALVTNASCYGESDGAIILSISGGSPGYEFLPGSSPLEQLPAGSYEYTIVDAHGCWVDIQAEIQQPPMLLLEIDAAPDSNSSSTGSINAIAIGGTPPYSYALNGDSSQIPMWEQLSAGSYLIEVMDSLNCFYQLSVEIESVSAVDEFSAEWCTVFPNPTQPGEMLTIQSHAIIDECMVMNGQGEIVYKSSPRSTRVNFSTVNWSPACYILIIQSSAGSRVARLVVLE
jgi:hypothetical protein